MKIIHYMYIMHIYLICIVTTLFGLLQPCYMYMHLYTHHIVYGVVFIIYYFMVVKEM